MNRVTEYFFDGPTSVFTQTEVATALGGTAPSRHALVKRAMAQGEILGIRRGLYCLAPRYQKKPVNVFAVSQRLYGPSYVSLESALAYHGWIPEGVPTCVCASHGNAREFETPLGHFLYRRVPQRVFYAEVDRCVDSPGNVFFVASPAKALADYVYVRKPRWTAIDEVFDSLRIEEDDYASVSPDELDRLRDNYTSRRVKNFLRDWKKLLVT